MKKLSVVVIFILSVVLLSSCLREDETETMLDGDIETTVQETTAEETNLNSSVKIIDKELIYDENNKLSMLGTYADGEFVLYPTLNFDGENIPTEYARLLAAIMYCQDIMSIAFNGNYSFYIKSGEELGMLVFKNGEMLKPVLLFPDEYEKFEENLDRETHAEIVLEEYNYIIENIKNVE